MITIVINEDFVGLVDPKILEDTATKVLNHQKMDEEVDLSIVVEDNAHLKELNLQFLGIDAPTDVLSFPVEEIDPDTGHSYLGDIIISLPMASDQAAAAGHPIQNEMQLLVVHGLLHLLGFDHATSELKKEMWQLQAELLENLSVKIKKLPED
jgi:probable rRNA maturation factor